MNRFFATTEALLMPRADLSLAQVDEMHALLATWFDGVTRAQFQRDLEEKNWCILLRRERRLTGFTTVLGYESQWQGAPVSVIYSGDTIVSPDAWGTAALPRAWIWAVEQIRPTLSGGRCFWLLLTSGFRTYRFLPVFWRRFYPCVECDQQAAEPPDREGAAFAPAIDAQQLRDALALERFGVRYDPAAGIVRFANPQRLRGELRAVPVGRAQDPHVAFFLERNPGHGEGDELVCLTELCDENLTPAGRRMKGLAEARQPSAECAAFS